MSVVFNSILDNDFYKFTMQCAVVKLFPDARVKYVFINRGKHSFPEGFDDALRKAINEMAKLQLTKAEKYFSKRVFKEKLSVSQSALFRLFGRIPLRSF